MSQLTCAPKLAPRAIRSMNSRIRLYDFARMWGARPRSAKSRSSPEQQDQNNDQQHEAEAAAIIMVWRSVIEATPAQGGGARHHLRRTTRIKAAYSGHYERFVALRNKYDPTNLFRLNQNIRPTL
jgi:hypothetical protein